MSEHRTRDYAMISTYPPTQCGIATFAAALSGGLYELGDDVGIVRVGGENDPAREIVVAELTGQRGEMTVAARNELSRADVVIVQHEYGIYGGRDGDDILKVLDGLFVPSIAILHTVLQRPTPHQIEVLNAVIDGVDVAVVMTQAAAETLSNRAMRADAMDALVQVREGAPLASALAGKKRFPGILAMFARLGEQTGQLPVMLDRAAKQLSAEVQRRAMQMATILEPLLIVGMGGVVMLIVLAVLLPIIQLNSFVK